MTICSTILYFGENPVGYELVKEDNGFGLHPTPDTKSNLVPPVISIVQSGDEWIVEGTHDADITEQVKKLINTQGIVDLPSRMSAAS